MTTNSNSIADILAKIAVAAQRLGGADVATDITIAELAEYVRETGDTPEARTNVISGYIAGRLNVEQELDADEAWTPEEIAPIVDNPKGHPNKPDGWARVQATGRKRWSRVLAAAFPEDKPKPKKAEDSNCDTVTDDGETPVTPQHKTLAEFREYVLGQCVAMKGTGEKNGFKDEPLYALVVEFEQKVIALKG